VAAVIFFVCAGLVLTGAFGVILGRNPVHCALFLLMTLVSIAVLYIQLEAQLVAAIQIVVYASAIVVLFLFVITLLGVDRHEPPDTSHPVQRVSAIVLGVLAFTGVVIMVHGNRWVTGAQSSRGALGPAAGGNVDTLAKSLFTDFVWAFEMTAVLLVIAVVGSVVLARRSGHRPEDVGPDADRVGAVAATRVGSAPVDGVESREKEGSNA
jgi:NADH-quinone oxidoreductase subunit J